jgi:hypothetical protein
MRQTGSPADDGGMASILERASVEAVTKLSLERQFPWLDLDLRPARVIANEAAIKRLGGGMRQLGEGMYLHWQRMFLGTEWDYYDDMVETQMKKPGRRGKPEPSAVRQLVMDRLFAVGGVIAIGTIPPLRLTFR